MPLVRHYDIFPKDPSLNFPPHENYRTRSLNAYKAEKRKIDAIMYRITDRQHTDTILATVARGIPVRLITEPVQYRLPSRMWHSWNVDRLYMGGVQIKHRAHAGLNHQKSVILYDQNGTIAGDQTHGDLRLLELDQPVGQRPGRAQHLLDQAGHRRPGS